MSEERPGSHAGAGGGVPTRLKLAATLLLVFAIALSPMHPWWIPAIGCVVAAAATLVQRAPLLPLGRRLLIASPFLAIVALGIPASHGFASGFDVAAGVLIRGILCLTATLSFVTTNSFEEIVAALQRLRTPTLFVWTLAFMHRYSFVLADELHRMRRAKEARSFRRSYWLEMQILGSFVGVLFVRAFERAERVYAAMCARGWTGEAPVDADRRGA